jgi:hypothetical protein
MRPFAFVGILAALAALSVRADEVTLKTYFPKPNTRVKVAVEEKTELKFTPRGAKEPQTETRTKSLEYEDEIQKVSDEKLVQKLKRHYTRAVTATNGVETKLKIQGETVLIEVETDFLNKFTYKTVPKGAPLDENSLALLDGEFSEGNRDGLIDAFPPFRAVKVDDPWPLEAGKLNRVLSDKKDSEFKVVDPTGSGKLLKLDKLPKADKKNPEPKQTGKFEVKITAQIVSAEKAQFVKLTEKPGSLNFHYTAEGVLDGSSPQGKAVAVMTLKGSGTVGGVGGDFEITITETRTTAPLPKK